MGSLADRPCPCPVCPCLLQARVAGGQSGGTTKRKTTHTQTGNLTSPQVLIFLFLFLFLFHFLFLFLSSLPCLRRSQLLSSTLLSQLVWSLVSSHSFFWFFLLFWFLRPSIDDYNTHNTVAIPTDSGNINSNNWLPSLFPLYGQATSLCLSPRCRWMRPRPEADRIQLT